MAVDTPKLTNIRLLAVKLEATTGTEETVTASDAVLIVYDPRIERDANTNERQQQAGKGQAASVPGVRSGSATFRIELAGGGVAGTSPAWAADLLPACDMTETSGAWAFTNRGDTATIALYEDGAKRVLYGARGNFKLVKENGQPGYVEFTFRGKYKEAADAAILAPTFPTVLPDANHDALTVGALSPVFTKMEFDAGNDVQIRENAGATDGTCMVGAAIVNRRPAGSLTLEQTALATLDMNGLVDSGTEQTVSGVIGATSGNIVTVGSTTCQLRSTQRTDMNGIVGREVALQFNGLSPFTITF